MNLVDVAFTSIYKNKQGNYAPMPKRMAKCTPDLQWALSCIEIDVEDKGGKLRLSDLFRSYDMQQQAHNDYTSGKKSAYSPRPGGSMHEAGRAFDVDLKALNMPLKDFWEIAAKYGVNPIIAKPDTKLKECWHFDKRGSHGIVYDYYAKGKGNNMKPYRAMATSGILAIGQKVDGMNNLNAYIQSALIILGYEIGNIDGIAGTRTKDALVEIGINRIEPAIIKQQLEQHLRERFFEEFI